LQINDNALAQDEAAGEQSLAASTGDGPPPKKKRVVEPELPGIEEVNKLGWMNPVLWKSIDQATHNENSWLNVHDSGY
jgi:hypothetical protein